MSKRIRILVEEFDGDRTTQTLLHLELPASEVCTTIRENPSPDIPWSLTAVDEGTGWRLVTLSAASLFTGTPEQAEGPPGSAP